MKLFLFASLIGAALVPQTLCAPGARARISAALMPNGKVDCPANSVPMPIFKGNPFFTYELGPNSNNENVENALNANSQVLMAAGDCFTVTAMMPTDLYQWCFKAWKATSFDYGWTTDGENWQMQNATRDVASYAVDCVPDAPATGVTGWRMCITGVAAGQEHALFGFTYAMSCVPKPDLSALTAFFDGLAEQVKTEMAEYFASIAEQVQEIVAAVMP